MLPTDNNDRLNTWVSQIESILFVSGEPVELELIKENLEIDENSLSLILIALHKKYNNRQSGLQVIITGNTIQLVSKPENYKIVQKTLSTIKKRPLSKAAYEVLAIIAYGQPVTRTEIESIRGVGSTSALQHLLDLGLVEEAGRKEVPGNPYLYKTTELFLQMAKIKDIKELPDFEEFEKKTKLNE